MIALGVLELVLAALVVVGFVSQILVPLVRGTPFFPLAAASRERALQRQRAKARQSALEARLEDEIAAERERLREKQGDTETRAAIRAYRMAQDAPEGEE